MRGVRRPEAGAGTARRAARSTTSRSTTCAAGTSRAMGLEDAKTFRDAHAILFAERAAPGAARRRSRSTRSATSRTTASGRRRPGDPLRDAARGPTRTTARTDWLDLEVEVTVDGVHIALAHVLEALTKGMDRVILRNGRHVRIDRPEFAHLAAARRGRGRAPVTSPSGGVRVGHHDLGPVGRARRGRHRRRAGGPVGAGRPGAARRSTRCPRSSRSGSRPSCAPTSSTASGGWPTCGRRASAASWPTTWGSARRCRRWRSSRTPGSAGAAPVPGGRADQRGGHVGARGRAVHPRARRPGGHRVAGPARATSIASLATAPTSWSRPTPCSASSSADVRRARRGAGWCSTRRRRSRTTRARPTRPCGGSTCPSGWRSPARPWRTG